MISALVVNILFLIKILTAIESLIKVVFILVLLIGEKYQGIAKAIITPYKHEVTKYKSSLFYL